MLQKKTCSSLWLPEYETLIPFINSAHQELFQKKNFKSHAAFSGEFAHKKRKRDSTVQEEPEKLSPESPIDSHLVVTYQEDFSGRQEIINRARERNTK